MRLFAIPKTSLFNTERAIPLDRNFGIDQKFGTTDIRAMLLRDWLRRERVKRIDFAKRVGISPSYLTDLCSGVAWPGRDVADRVMQETGGEVTPVDFLDGNLSCEAAA
jgi:3,4-dihydroxy 2-butanone 4-phosphate synthase/GTP cyclohydrolase II